MRIRRFLYSVVVGMVIAVSSASLPVVGASTFPGQNGKIAYVTAHGESTTIQIMNADGSGNRLLAKNAKSPTWSPNGRKLAFVLQDRLYTMNVNGGHKQRLTHVADSIERSPAWSADGERLAFVRTAKTNNKTQSAVFVTKANGADQQNVTGWLQNGEYNSPSFSPDGTRLVYEKRIENNRELYIKNLIVNYERLLTTLSDDVDSRVSWSPNGKKILYNDSSSEVYTIWPDGTHRAVISDGESYHASWSPEGNRIAFLEDPNDESISISGPDGSISYMPIDKTGYQMIGTPHWSPDGKKLLFTLAAGQSMALFSYECDLQNAKPVKLAEGAITDMSWQAIR